MPVIKPSNIDAGAEFLTRSRIRLSVPLFCAALSVACGNGEPAAEKAALDAATLNYGYGMVHNDAVTYQPDVVAVGGGPKSIRSASADGVVWIIDGHAPHADELQPGKIMLLTSSATGRIMKIEPQGEDLAVTLGPFHLGEVLRDADLTTDVAFSADDVAYQLVPELPGMYRDYATPGEDAARAEYVSSTGPTIEEEEGSIFIRLAPIRVAAASNTPNSGYPAAVKSAPKISVNGWELEPSMKEEVPKGAGGERKLRIGLKIQRVGPGGLKAGIDFGLLADDLHFKSRTVYRDGKYDVGASSLTVEGLKGMELAILSGISKAVGQNVKIRIEVPIEIIQQIPPAATYGVPLVAQMKMKFIFETALGGSNATMESTGSYTLKGPFGMQGGSLMMPTAIDVIPVIEGLKGVSLGVSGLVFAQEVRFLVGLGAPAFFAGPYAKITGSFGLTKSADVGPGLGMPPCRATTVKFDAGAGVGFQLRLTEKAALDAVSKLIGKSSGAKAEWEVFEWTETFFRKDHYAPPNRICKI